MSVVCRFATTHAQIFTGGLFIGGVEIWKDVLPRDIEVMKSNHYMSLCGSEDQALRSARHVFRAYKAEGISNAEVTVIRGTGHITPDTSDFEKAIVFLDSRQKTPLARRTVRDYVSNLRLPRADEIWRT